MLRGNMIDSAQTLVGLLQALRNDRETQVMQAKDFQLALQVHEALWCTALILVHSLPLWPRRPRSKSCGHMATRGQCRRSQPNVSGCAAHSFPRVADVRYRRCGATLPLWPRTRSAQSSTSSRTAVLFLSRCAADFRSRAGHVFQAFV
jgi:hypothetical protein